MLEAVSSGWGCGGARVCDCEDVAAVDAASCCVNMVCCLFNLYLEFSCKSSCTSCRVSTSSVLIVACLVSSTKWKTGSAYEDKEDLITHCLKVLPLAI